MTQPCEQAPNIIQIRREMVESFSEVRESQQRMIGLLENVARQDERIKAMADTLHRHETSINGLYSRVRKIEEAPGSTASRAWWVIFGGAVAAIGGVITKLVEVAAK
ncbi:MAG: hypothetical protein FDZ69_07470 [Deltaproteobacteria bacterium]|nr:MAG: hypothetical protein FDZ69_07470 [Deltaproteobacteria bacterium]